MSLIPAKASEFKLSSWVFDGRVEQNCLHAPVKVAGIGTFSSWIYRDQELRRHQQAVATDLPNSLVGNSPAAYRLAISYKMKNC